MKQRPEVMLWLDDHRGQYIPRDFANSFVDRANAVSGVDAGQWETLESGPDHEWYWDCWNEVCDSAIITDEHGNKYRIHQDGACWLIPDGMEWSDQDDWFEWPSDFEMVDGRYTCRKCGYQYSAMMSEDDIPDRCECDEPPDPPGWEGGFADNH